MNLAPAVMTAKVAVLDSVPLPPPLGAALPPLVIEQAWRARATSTLTLYASFCYPAGVFAALSWV